jgi:hypothetical protein
MPRSTVKTQLHPRQTIPTRSLSMREMKQCKQDDHYLSNRDQASLDVLT